LAAASAATVVKSAKGGTAAMGTAAAGAGRGVLRTVLVQRPSAAVVLAASAGAAFAGTVAYLHARYNQVTTSLSLRSRLYLRNVYANIAGAVVVSAGTPRCDLAEVPSSAAVSWLTERGKKPIPCGEKITRRKIMVNAVCTPSVVVDRFG
jgi:hypothetical protein